MAVRGDGAGEEEREIRDATEEDDTDTVANDDKEECDDTASMRLIVPFRSSNEEMDDEEDTRTTVRAAAELRAARMARRARTNTMRELGGRWRRTVSGSSRGSTACTDGADAQEKTAMQAATAVRMMMRPMVRIDDTLEERIVPTGAAGSKKRACF